MVVSGKVVLDLDPPCRHLHPGPRASWEVCPESSVNQAHPVVASSWQAGGWRGPGPSWQGRRVAVRDPA